MDTPLLGPAHVVIRGWPLVGVPSFASSALRVMQVACTPEYLAVRQGWKIALTCIFAVVTILDLCGGSRVWIVDVVFGLGVLVLCWLAPHDSPKVHKCIAILLLLWLTLALVFLQKTYDTIQVLLMFFLYLGIISVLGYHPKAAVCCHVASILIGSCFLISRGCTMLDMFLFLAIAAIDAVVLTCAFAHLGRIFIRDVTTQAVLQHCRHGYILIDLFTGCITEASSTITSTFTQICITHTCFSELTQQGPSFSVQDLLNASERGDTRFVVLGTSDKQIDCRLLPCFATSTSLLVCMILEGESRPSEVAMVFGPGQTVDASDAADSVHAHRDDAGVVVHGFCAGVEDAWLSSGPSVSAASFDSIVFTMLRDCSLTTFMDDILFEDYSRRALEDARQILAHINAEGSYHGKRRAARVLVGTYQATIFNEIERSLEFLSRNRALEQEVERRRHAPHVPAHHGPSLSDEERAFAFAVTDAHVRNAKAQLLSEILSAYHLFHHGPVFAHGLGSLHALDIVCCFLGRPSCFPLASMMRRLPCAMAMSALRANFEHWHEYE